MEKGTELESAVRIKMRLWGGFGGSKNARIAKITSFSASICNALFDFLSNGTTKSKIRVGQYWRLFLAPQNKYQWGPLPMGKSCQNWYNINLRKGFWNKNQTGLRFAYRVTWESWFTRYIWVKTGSKMLRLGSTWVFDKSCLEWPRKMSHRCFGTSLGHWPGLGGVSVSLLHHFR